MLLPTGEFTLYNPYVVAEVDDGPDERKTYIEASLDGPGGAIGCAIRVVVASTPKLCGPRQKSKPPTITDALLVGVTVMPPFVPESWTPADAPVCATADAAPVYTNTVNDTGSAFDPEPPGVTVTVIPVVTEPPSATQIAPGPSPAGVTLATLRHVKPRLSDRANEFR
jgi:hypothetical protein